MTGIFTRILGSERRSDNWTAWAEVLEHNKDESAGINVTPSSALRYTAVWACIRILSETLASLPLHFYERMEEGRRRADEYYLAELLQYRPNPLMTAYEFKETLQGHLAGWGNAYCQLEYGDDGRITELWPLHPGGMLESKIENKRRVYHYLLPNGRLQWLAGDIIWHLRGMSSDGYNGLSPLEVLRQAVGLGLAAETFGAKFFANDARPGLVLEHPGQLSPAARKNITESWETEHKGVSKSHRIQLLEEGLKIHEIGIKQADAQFIETRKLQREEIASAFRVPPHMIGALERATNNNIEHQGIEFAMYSMRSWFVRWEQSIFNNLMLPEERKKYYPEFMFDGLLRGDIQSRYAAYAVARQNGWMNADEIREKENMNPLPDGQGKIYFVSPGMTPIDAAAAGTAALPGSQPAGEPGGRALLEAEHEKRDVLDGEQRKKEERAVKAATRRFRLVRSYRRMYQETASRILRRERNDVGAGARRNLPRGRQAFEDFMTEFYRGHAEWTLRQMMPLAQAYGGLVADETGEELGRTPDWRAVDRFIDTYVGGYAARHAGISQDKLKKRLDEAAESGGDGLEAVLGELDEWPEQRAGMIADEEPVRFNNALAKMVYLGAGITAMRFVAIGDSCPYCSYMDGRRVGIDEMIIPAGGSLQPEGAESPLTSTTDLGHPPLHAGCDCIMVAD